MTEGGPRSRSSQAGTQRVARTISHGRVDVGRSHGGDLAVRNDGWRWSLWT